MNNTYHILLGEHTDSLVEYIIINNPYLIDIYFSSSAFDMMIGVEYVLFKDPLPA